MPRLNASELEQLIKHVQHAISPTPYACSSLVPLDGGTTSFVFRGTLIDDTIGGDVPNQSNTKTVIVKYATRFASINQDFEIDDTRAITENVMLLALQKLPKPPVSSGAKVTVPRSLHFNQGERIQVIEDLAPAVDIATLSSKPSSCNTIGFTNIGVAVGTWLRAFHDWTSEREHVNLQREIADRCVSMRKLKLQITYDSFLVVLQQFPAILKAHEVALERVEQLAKSEFEKQWETEERTDGVWGIIHGDFWTGNILNRVFGGAIDTDTNTYLHVIDWEFAQYGHRAYDLGQMIGDLLEKNHFAPSKMFVNLLKGFVQGYGALNDRMAFRVVIHVGVHMINWCTRNGLPHGDMLLQVEELVQWAVELIVKGLQQDRKWFEKCVLSCLFS